MHSLGDPQGYYEALGVSRTATAEEIRAAFRERAKRYHPDRAGAAADADRFQRLREAYDVLRDVERRRQYDAEALRRVREQTEARRGASWQQGGRRRREPPVRPPRPPRRGGMTFLAAVLGLAFLGMSGLWWSTQQQLETRSVQVAELYYRLSELQPGLRQTAFTTLADATAAGGGEPVFSARIEFEGTGPRLDVLAEGRLEEALAGLGQAIGGLPPGRNWVVLVESGLPVAATPAGLALDGWELAMLRIAEVMDHLAAGGIPPRRLASRLETGSAASVEAGRTGPAVRISLLCCFAAGS